MDRDKGKPSAARTIISGALGILIGFGLMRLGQARMSELASTPSPGLGTTTRVDETPMMQILIWLGVGMIIVSVVYVIAGLAKAGRRQP